MKFIFIISIFVLGLASCLSPINLFDEGQIAVDEGGIGNFYATHIFDDHITNDLWFSPDGGCLQVTPERENTYSGAGALHITWDKGKGNCDWIGMGIGWDGWSGKNLGSIYDKAAISFKVRTDGKPLKNLPIALCLEDHGGLQAWVGFSSKMIVGDTIGSEWATVNIPILAFNWREADADVTNLKQFLIQFEASGDIYMDQVEIIEHQGSLRSRSEMIVSTQPYRGGSIFDKVNTYEPTVSLNGNDITLFADQTHLHVLAQIQDNNPLQNSHSGDDIWNGDAIEIAFSTNSQVSSSRSFYLKSDKQIGIKATEDPMIWDWKTHKEIEGANIVTGMSDGGYFVNASIPFSDLGVDPFQPDQLYGLEVAINQGDIGGRKIQLRWNSPDRDGFDKDPSLWGEVMTKNEMVK